MNKLPTQWRPLSVEALRTELAGFPDWVLCGGYAVARITGVDSRAHGDIDVGAFRSQLSDCLNALGRERVWLCRNGVHHAWDGGKVPTEVHEAVLAAGDAETGVTIHLVNAEYDEGRILAQCEVPVRSDDTVESLAARVLEREHSFLVETLRGIASGRMPRAAE